MIIYRQIRMPPSVFDRLLVDTWSQCGLPTPDPPCEYVRDMGNKPGLECYTHQQCIEKGLGNFCSEENTCETRIDPIPPPGPPPTSDCEEFQLEIVQIQIRIATLQARLQAAEREKKDIEFRLDHANRQYDEARKGGPVGGRAAWAIRVQQIEQELAAKNLEINGLQLKISQEEKLLLSKKTELQICQSASQGAVTGNEIQN